MVKTPGRGSSTCREVWPKTKQKKKEDTCIPMFIAALFTVAKTWKQPKCPWTVEYIKIVSGSMTYRPGMSSVLLLSHKKEQNNAICSNMDGLRDCHTE